MEAVGLLQTGSTVLLNSTFAWLTGALFSAWCLRHAAGPISRLLWRSVAVAAFGCLAGALLALWCACALMADLGLGEALRLMFDMLVDTAYGRAGLASLIVMFALAVLALIRPASYVPAVLLLAIFAWTRASMSHAGEHGLFSLGTLMEGMHLLLVALWTGVVAIAGWMVLPRTARADAQLQPYLSAVSTAATVALAGIVASGLYNAWQRMQSLDQMTSHPYGMALSVKLALFALAVGLGAWNRFYGFPAARHEPARAIAVLRFESVVLLAAMAAAAVLTLQEPPR